MSAGADYEDLLEGEYEGGADGREALGAAEWSWHSCLRPPAVAGAQAAERDANSLAAFAVGVSSGVHTTESILPDVQELYDAGLKDALEAEGGLRAAALHDSVKLLELVRTARVAKQRLQKYYVARRLGPLPGDSSRRESMYHTGEKKAAEAAVEQPDREPPYREISEEEINLKVEDGEEEDDDVVLEEMAMDEWDDAWASGA